MPLSKEEKAIYNKNYREKKKSEKAQLLFINDDSEEIEEPINKIILDENNEFEINGYKGVAFPRELSQKIKKEIKEIKEVKKEIKQEEPREIDEDEFNKIIDEQVEKRMKLMIESNEKTNKIIKKQNDYDDNDDAFFFSKDVKKTIKTTMIQGLMTISIPLLLKCCLGLLAKSGGNVTHQPFEVLPPSQFQSHRQSQEPQILDERLKMFTMLNRQ